MNKQIEISEFREVDLSIIDRDPNQPREDFDEAKLELLAASIKNEGYAQPPLIKKHPDHPDRFMIVVGERRIRAMRTAGMTSAKFLIATGNLDTYSVSVLENLHREDLNPIEEAKGLKKLHDEGATWARVSQLSGRSKQNIMLKQRLLQLPEEVQQLVRKGLLPQGGAINLNQFKGERGRQIRLAMDLVAGKKPPELLQKKLGDTGAELVAAFSASSGDPGKLFTKIVHLAHEVPTAAAAMMALQQSDKSMRLLAWRDIGAATQRNILERLDLIARVASDCHSLLSSLPRRKDERVSDVLRLETPVGHKAAPKREEKKKVADKRRVKKIAKKRVSVKGSIASNGSKSASRSPKSDVQQGITAQTFRVAEAVMSEVVISPRGRRFQLDRVLLARAFRSEAKKVEGLVTQTLRITAAHWDRDTSSGKNGPERDLIMFTKSLKADLQVQNLPELVALMQQATQGQQNTVDLSSLSK